MASGRHALARLLQERREAMGYSRSRVGELVGIPPGTIEGWEIGRVAKPPLQDVLRLARVLRISPEEIDAAVLGPADANADRGNASGDGGRGAPLLEQAITLFGWSDEQVAAALETSVSKVRAWRSGTVATTLPELMTVSALLGLHAATSAGGEAPPVHDIAAAVTQMQAGDNGGAPA